eukprot:s804_g19.t1
MEILQELTNYVSVESQKDEAMVEVDRYIQKGFCKALPLDELHARFPKGTASRLALILKQKPDGSTKRRIVIDMKKSKGNDRAKVSERIILPRAQDIVTSLRVMRAREHELLEQGTQRSALKTSRKYEESITEFILIDLQDAFCHFGVHPDELKHCVSPGLESGTALVWVAMLFGFKGAPLVMSRLSAAVGRLIQSTFHPAAGQTQVYIDDIALVLRGSTELRNLQLSNVLYLLAAFGVQVSMKKGERGRRVVWIGTTFEIQEHEVVLGTPKKLIDEIKSTMGAWAGRGMIPTKDLRSFLGKLVWVSGIVPRLRWTVTALYAVLTKALQEDKTEAERAARRAHDQRPKIGLVAVKGLGTALPWLRAVFEVPELMLIRRERLDEREPQWGLVTDASPKGLGGVLINKVGGTWLIVEAFEALITKEQADALEIKHLDASGQAVVEGLAILRALQVWATKIQGGPVVIRSDSSVALAMTKKLSSPTKSLNYVASEIAVLLEKIQVTKLLPQHIPGSLNKEADWLSRIGDRGEMPASLQGIKLKRTVALSERNLAMVPPGISGSAWVQTLPHPNGVYDIL